MLGWEFPPIINGGLGVACHDLSSAMSELANVTMVVPKSSLGFKVGNVNLLGINNIDINSLEMPSNYRNQKLPFEMLSVPADLNPYYSEGQQVLSQDGHVSAQAGGKEKLEAFKIDNLYGGDVINKVSQYAAITTSVASKLDFDIIHAHDWMTMLAGIRIKQQTGRPLVMHIHSLEVDRSGPASKGWVYQLEKNGMKYADLVMPVSNFTANNIEQYYGINRKKMAVVHNGSNAVTPYKSQRKFKEKMVLFVGRLTRQKCPEKFLDIAARVLEKRPDVRFVMAGTGDYFQSLLEQSAYKQISNRFHMTGFLNMDKLNHLFSMSDVYCMPSISEPFGLTAVEAAQFNIPCVISKQSGVAEVLKGALKFDYWDTRKAADYIVNLLDDQTLRKKVVEDTTASLNSISWKLSARKIMNVYSERQFI